MKHSIWKLSVLMLFSSCAPYSWGDGLIATGTFDGDEAAIRREFRCSAHGPSNGRFEIFTENLSWNKCGRLVAGAVHGETSGGKPVDVTSALLRAGGGRDGVPVDPDTYYEYAFEVKSDTVKTVILRLHEVLLKDGKEVMRALPDRKFACGTEWRRHVGRCRTNPAARRLEICFIIWTRLGSDIEANQFKPGDSVLIDNVSLVRSERYTQLVRALQTAKEPVRVAPIPVETDPACPFMPLELAQVPTQIVVRAAVNEKKPLPVAVGNMTGTFAQYRVVLEQEPVRDPATGIWRDNGAFGLAGFPAEKIAVREALRFKDVERAPVTVRFDPLVDMNGCSVISVPPKEAGVVWFDFDTGGVAPGTYRGRLRVIPLGCGASYAVRGNRYVRERSDEVILPLALTVDPIVLPKESVRPAHFCSPCLSAAEFELASDVGSRIYALATHLVRPEALGNPASAFRRTVDGYAAWAKRRGMALTYFVKYDALRCSQEIFNPKKDPEKKWAAWDAYVQTLDRLMREAGVAYENYYVLVRDEPTNAELPEVAEAQRRLKRVCPKMRTYISCCEWIAGKIDYLSYLEDTTDLWSLTSTMYTGETRTRLTDLKRRRGTKLLHYLCHTSVKQPLAGYYRRHCWRGECWGLDADMLYAFNAYHQGLRNELCFKVVPNGEITYAADGKVFPTVRYMAYREGVTDIRYVQALRDANPGNAQIGKFLDGVCARVMANDCTRADPAKVREEIRAMLLNPATPPGENAP